MGNPTSYLGKTLTWEGKQLTGYSHGSTGISYAYNEDGLRLQKIVNNETTEYCYNGSVLIGMKIGTGNTAKIFRFSCDASGNVAAVDYSADNGSTFTTYYYLRNAQGDVVKMIDSSGNTVVEYTYDSWGKLIATTGSLANTVGANQPFRYRGYVYDEETGFYYLQSRYYDPTTCRFISADVLLSTGQGVIGHNSFAYCGNNPVVRLDSEGNFFFTIVGAIAGAIGGGLVAAVTGGNILEGALSGAVSGAIAGLATDIVVSTGGIGAVGAVAIVAGMGAASGVAGEAIDSAFAPEDKKSTLSDYFIAGITGAAMNVLTFGMGNGIPGAKETLKKVGIEASKVFTKQTLKATGKYIAKALSKNATKHMLKKACSFMGESIGTSWLGGFATKYLQRSAKYVWRVLF